MPETETLAPQPNVWQKISDATGTVVTPANLLDAAGFAGAKYGIENLDSWQGIIVAASSFLADVADGKIARATHTSSELGETVDAAGDKVKLAYALYEIHRLKLAPKALLGAVALQNSLNVAMTAADQLHNGRDHVLHSSWFGKRAIFLQQVGLGLHVVAAQMERDDTPRSRRVRQIANVLGWSGVGLGIAASAGYGNRLLGSRKTKKH